MGSESQSYSINNGNQHNENEDDYVISDKIELDFTIHFKMAKNASSKNRKTHKCVFGDSDCNKPLSSNWNSDSEADSVCETEANICSFKLESFEELTHRIKNAENLDRNAIGFSIWFELQITNIAQLQNKNGFGKKSRFDPMKIVHKRPIFKKRKITKFVGLRNEGATCYMNSMLQTLYHIAALRRNVYKIPVGHEAEQKKKADLIEKAKKESEEKQQQKDNDNMSLCEEEPSDLNNKVRGSSSSDDCDEDEDDDLHRQKKKKAIKPPISLELQRLFYQLQTGAESNHQSEYDLNIEDIAKQTSTIEDVDGNDSDCSVFSLQSDTE